MRHPILRRPARLLHALALCCALSVSTAAWATAHTPPPLPVQQDDDSQRTAQAIRLSSSAFDVLLAEIYATRQQYARAYSHLMRAAETSADTRLFARAVSMALQGQAPDEALRTIAIWKKQAPQDAEASILALQVYSQLRQLPQATSTLIHALQHATPERRSALIHGLPVLYGNHHAGQTSAAVWAASRQSLQQVLQPYAQQPDTAFVTALADARMAILAQQYGDAMQALEHTQTVPADPHNIGAVLPNRELPAVIALDVLRQTSRTQPELAARAERLIRAHSDQPDASAELQVIFAQALLGLERLEAGRAVLQQLSQRQPDSSIALLLLAAIDMEQRQLDQAEARLQRYLQLRTRHSDTPSPADDEDLTPSGSLGNPALIQRMRQRHNARGDVQAYRMLTAIADERGQYEAGNQWVLRMHPPSLRHNTMLQRAGTLGQNGQYAAALHMAQELPQDTPEQIGAKALLQAQLLEKSGQLQQAIDTLSTAMVQQRASAAGQQARRTSSGTIGTSHTPTRPGRKASRPAASAEAEIESAEADSLPSGQLEMRYVRGYLYGQTGQIAQAERDLRHVIRQQPESAHAYNALGYLLADRGERLAEARQLIARALELEPQNGAIADSMGWVEYRLGHLEQARAHLQHAFRLEQQAEIAAHYGEVLWTLGQQQQARAIWRMGLQLDAQDSTLLQTLQRFGISAQELATTPSPDDPNPADHSPPAPQQPQTTQP